MPKISVIMTVYNQKEDYLKKSIGSILSQTFSDFEFLIVDDGSKKETLLFLEKQAEDDSRITLIKNTSNIGPAKSSNIAIKRSRGEFIARIDSDDIANPDRLEKQLDFLKKNGLDLINADCDIIDEKENVVKEKIVRLPKNLKKELMKGNFSTHSTFFGKREVFEELYNEEFPRSLDYEFLLRIIGKGYDFGHMNEKVLKYRIHNQSLSKTTSKKQEYLALKARLLAIRKYGYSPIYFFYIIRSMFIFVLPYELKLLIAHRLTR